MQEIQEIQKLIKEQSDKGTLAQFDVRDYEFRRVMKKENRADIVQAYDSAPDIVAQTAIGKTWAKERTGYDYDYDASLFSNLIYQAAMFPEGEIRKSHGYEYQISYDGIDYRGDTMCSWSTTVNRCLRHTRPPRLDDIDETLATCIVDFMQVVYTIGNFIPAPSAFQKRGSCPSRDYWDLALAAIYHYYQSPDKIVCEDTDCTFIRPKPYSVRWLLDGIKNAENCKPWLNCFESWDNFVEENFMQPFLKNSEKVNGHYGPPDELWEGHFAYSGLPQNEDEFQQFFTNATQRILARGEMIAKKVKETIESAQ